MEEVRAFTEHFNEVLAGTYPHAPLTHHSSHRTRTTAHTVTSQRTQVIPTWPSGSR
jgi:hypothetical protein